MFRTQWPLAIARTRCFWAEVILRYLKSKQLDIKMVGQNKLNSSRSPWGFYPFARRGMFLESDRLFLSNNLSIFLWSFLNYKNQFADLIAFIELTALTLKCCYKFEESVSRRRFLLDLYRYIVHTMYRYVMKLWDFEIPSINVQFNEWWQLKTAIYT